MVGFGPAGGASFSVEQLAEVAARHCRTHFASIQAALGSYARRSSARQPKRYSRRPVACQAMDFELSPELSELQSTVRRLAQDKVRPRAREIDKSGEYPSDLFEVFRDAGLLGLVHPGRVRWVGVGESSDWWWPSKRWPSTRTPPPSCCCSPGFPPDRS